VDIFDNNAISGRKCGPGDQSGLKGAMAGRRKEGQQEAGEEAIAFTV
jgi:hypothetical protein